MPYRYTIKVSEKVYKKLIELTRKYGLESPNQLLEKLLFDGATLSNPDGVTPSDCVARRARKGGKTLNAYILECRDAKAFVPFEILGGAVAEIWLGDKGSRLNHKFVVQGKALHKFKGGSR
jgi:hypothetical protein